jgi:hypothetical protein
MILLRVFNGNTGLYEDSRAFLSQEVREHTEFMQLGQQQQGRT